MWKRVIAPTILVSALWIAVSGVTTYYISWLSDSYGRVLKENVTTIRAVQGMQDVLWKLQAAVLDAAPDQDPESRTEVDALVSQFLAHLDEARRSVYTSEELVLVDAADRNFQAYRARLERGLSLARGSPEDGVSFREKILRLALPVEESCRQLLELDERLLAVAMDRNARYSRFVNPVRLGFLIIGPILGVLLGLWVARGLHRSISQISITLSDAAGELEREVGRVTVHPRADLCGLQEQVQAVSSRIRQTVEELEGTRRGAMRAERLAAVGQLAAGVAHELRNPLTSVKLLVQTAAQRSPSRSLSERELRVVQQEILRMEEIIQGLLDFARPTPLRRLRHDLRQTVRRALNLVEGRAKQQQVAIARELPEQPILVDADPEQLHQVFVNLALNGIESMEQGGTLRVAMEAGGRRSRVVFADSGAGISPAVLEHIFEPFVTSKERGTGLGLAISRRIVEAHGGTLSAANRPEGGALFTVELPSCTEPPSTAPREDCDSAERIPVSVSRAE